MNSTFLLFYSPRPRGNWSSKLWELSVQLEIPEISAGTSIGTDHFGLIRPEYSGPALKVFHGLVISVGRPEITRSICQNCCPQYRSFVSCVQEQ